MVRIDFASKTMPVHCSSQQLLRARSDSGLKGVLTHRLNARFDARASNYGCGTNTDTDKAGIE